MKALAFFLEEPSAKEFLKGIVPHLIPEEVHVTYHVFRGKQDLDKCIENRLRRWQKPNTSFVVMRDQDAGDCRVIKRSLLKKCIAADRPGVLIRIACRELESFYLGDLRAVEQGLQIKGLARKQGSKRFRNPDALQNPSSELGRLTQEKYQKIGGSRAIAPHLSLEGNKSVSFRALIAGLKSLCD